MHTREDDTDFRARIGAARGAEFVFVRELRDGISRVLVFRDTSLGREVVAKTVLPELVSPASGGAPNTRPVVFVVVG